MPLRPDGFYGLSKCFGEAMSRYYYDRFGIQLDHHQIIVTTGGSEAIIFGFMACLDPGDEVIVPEPFYANYNGFAVEAEVKVIPVTSGIESGFALPPIADFEKKITPKTKAILICNPNNPTGALYPVEVLQQIVEVARQHHLIVFADEIYDNDLYDGEVHTSIASLADDVLFLTLNGLYENYRSCGYRAGWMVVSGDKNLRRTISKA